MPVRSKRNAVVFVVSIAGDSGKFSKPTESSQFNASIG